MNTSPERRQVYEQNFAFLDSFNGALKTATRSLPALRVLDYGAGVFPYPFSFFRELHPKQETIAFNPHVVVSLMSPRDFQDADQTWTNVEPKGGEFDLVICHFSLHNMNELPKDVIRKLLTYKPKFVAVAEYDYKGTTTQEFEQTFVGDAEQKELRVVFQGDINQCHTFHSRMGADECERALVEGGFKVAIRGSGQGVAKYKFFLIGQMF